MGIETPADSMPSAAKFDYRDEFVAYLKANGVPRAWGNYITWMNRASKWLGRTIGPTDFSNADEADALVDRIGVAARRQGSSFNSFDRTNLLSVLRKYAEMVEKKSAGSDRSDGAERAMALDAGEPPPRVRTEITRVVRDTVLCRKIKRLYDYRCQRCGERVELGAGEFYAEAHHLRPLAMKHGGSDVEENIICVCPTCHVLFDYSVVPIKPSTLKVQKHRLSPESIAYHNAECAKRVN